MVVHPRARQHPVMQSETTERRKTMTRTYDVTSTFVHMIDVDPEVSRMGDPAPPLFWLRDPEANTLMVVQ